MEQLARQIATLPAHEHRYLPLGVGHHVDHQLTRAAGERHPKQATFYYEDYPYTQREGAVAATLAETTPATAAPHSWRPSPLTLSEAALQAKIAAVLAYESQLSTFFTSPADVALQLTAYARQVLAESSAAPTTLGATPAGAERVWQLHYSHSFHLINTPCPNYNS
jgi:hypothetical protein